MARQSKLPKISVGGQVLKHINIRYEDADSKMSGSEPNQIPLLRTMLLDQEREARWQFDQKKTKVFRED